MAISSHKLSDSFHCRRLTKQQQNYKYLDIWLHVWPSRLHSYFRVPVVLNPYMLARCYHWDYKTITLLAIFLPWSDLCSKFTSLFLFFKNKFSEGSPYQIGTHYRDHICLKLVEIIFASASWVLGWDLWSIMPGLMGTYYQLIAIYLYSEEQVFMPLFF